MICIRTAVPLFLIFLSAANAAAQSPEAESYYLDNIDSTVRSKCVGCHVAGGRAGYTSLLFTDSASNNHNAFDEYVNTPSLGAKASKLLEKIRGADGHGGGVQVSQGSAEYQKFEGYMELLSYTPNTGPSVPGAPSNVSAVAGNQSATVSFSAPSDNGGAAITSYTATSNPGDVSGSCAAPPCSVTGLTNGTAYTFTVSATNEAGEGAVSAPSNSVTPSTPSVFRMTLEEPLNGKTHMGIGNLRGWAVASSGITKVEVLVDGVYVYDAPYGGQRGDIGGAFPEVQNSEKSGFSLAYNYSALSIGEHTVTVVAHSGSGNVIEKSATFNVVKFAKNFIPDPNAVDLDDANCSLAGDAVKLFDAIVDEVVYDITLKWRKQEQGFEIIEIR